MKELSGILEFKCPYWEDLPDEGLMSREVVEYINDTLEPIFLDSGVITPTMIQNYSKWKLLPEIKGRKYDRVRIAMLIVISVYKNILDINGVKAGINLQLKIMSIDKSYNIFAESLNKAIERTFEGSLEEKFTLRQLTMENYETGVDLVAHAFAFKLMAKLILKYGGYLTLKEEDQDE